MQSQDKTRYIERVPAKQGQETTGNMNTKKVKKGQMKNNSYRGVDLPNVVDMDTLAYASDDELERHASYLHAERDRASRFEYDLRPWEVEISYIQREMKIRHDRHLAHERFMQSSAMLDLGDDLSEDKTVVLN